VRSEPFLDGVVDAVKDEGPLGGQAAFGKSRGTRREHYCEWIIFVNVDPWFF
jgi:hypothetical protein